MSVQTFIEAMPKADLHVHLDGAASRETMLMIAEQNEVEEGIKHFKTWLDLLEKPDYDRLDDLMKMVNGWIKFPEDLTRLTYNIGTVLAKQNVRYAEITFNPSAYPDLTLTLEQFLLAINDGRDRAQRAWGIQIHWIVAIPRDEPRKSDEYSRWASTAGARKGGVVGLGLVGSEAVQPVGQFERAFHAAEKKDLSRTIHAGDQQGADGVLKAITSLLPNRIDGGWGVADSAEVCAALVEQQIALDVTPARALRHKKIATLAEYPLRKLYDTGVTITLGSDMPLYYKTSLKELYAAAVQKDGLSIDELKDVALNGVRASFADAETKQALVDSFTADYAALSAEHLV